MNLLIIDGNSILNRAFYGVRPLNAPDGTPTNAVFGFLNILFKQIKKADTPDYICVAFDVHAKTFRHKLYDEYKAHRKPTPEELLVQMPIIKEVLSAMDICMLEKEGYEADDIIGTVASDCERNDINCVILSGDKDDLQLASDKVCIDLVITKGGATDTISYNKDMVKEVYGVTPHEFIDVKALMGDPSDNIPGVKGIGEKTALTLIQKYGSIESIYKNIGDIKGSVQNKLIQNEATARLSKILATIDRNVPITINYQDMANPNFDNQDVYNIFKRLNFKSFIKKLTNVIESENESEISDDDIFNLPEPMPPIQIDNAETVNLISELLSASVQALFYNLTSEGFFNSIEFCVDDKVYNLEQADMQTLKLIFENEDIHKVGYDIKSDIKLLRQMGVDYKGIAFDISLAAYISGVSPDAKRDSYVANEIKYLYDRYMQIIKSNGQERLYYEIELPLLFVLYNMEETGVYVDKKRLTEFAQKASDELSVLEKNIYELAGEEFNINSPKQVGEVLFERLMLKGSKKTKSGYSTDIEVLEKIRDSHPVVAAIIEYRKLSKLKSTYADGLLKVINPSTGRIHSNFKQTVTTTGRISSTEPNLQNIPVRTEIGREIRRMFTAPPGKVLIDADYSQIELRILTHISGDETMQNAFLNNIDIHTVTASQIFAVPIDEVTKEMRQSAKAVNFGIVYGIGDFSLAQDIGISRAEAREYIDGYLSTYPKIKDYMNDIVEFGIKKGYVKTLLERRRYIPELRVSNKNVQAFGKRAAMNAPIQGSAADIIKIAMVRIFNVLKDRGYKSRLILQVHDELIIEAYESEAKEVAQLMRYEMENAYKLDVPLTVDLDMSNEWA